jgi:hypothetical protein
VIDPSTGFATNATATTGLLTVGYFAETVDNSGGVAGAKAADIEFPGEKRLHWWANGTEADAIVAADKGKPCYWLDNQSVSIVSTGKSQAGIIRAVDSLKGVLVEMLPVNDVALAEPTITSFVNATHNHQNDAGGGVLAAPYITSVANVGYFSNKGSIEIPLGSAILATGAPMTTFSDGDSAVPGFDPTAKVGPGIRWNNKATHDKIMVSVPVPPDANVAANMTLKINCAKTGATNNAGNTTTFDVQAYNHAVGALYDADADFGGTTSAVTPNATAKTIQQVSLTLALANLPAVGSSFVLDIDPTDGTLTTDDIIITRMWVEYTKKVVA